MADRCKISYMKIEKTEKSPVDLQVEVTLQPEDFWDEYQDKLLQSQRNAQIKGFRKGRVPMRLIKKWYGKNILWDIIYKKSSEALTSFLQQEQIPLYGDPILAGITPEQLDLDQSQDYSFRYLMWYMPHRPLKGLDASTEVPMYKVEIDDDYIAKKWEAIRIEHGQDVEVDIPIDATCKVRLALTEIVEPNEERPPHTSEMRIVSWDNVTDEFKKRIFGKRKGDVLDRVDVYHIFRNLSEDGVRYFVLNIKDDTKAKEVGKWFRAEITEVTQRQPAAVDEELFKAVFGEEESIATEEEALQTLRERYEQHFQSKAEGLAIEELYKILRQANSDLPRPVFENPPANEEEAKRREEFLKKFVEEYFLHLLLTKYKVDLTKEEVFKAVEQHILSKYLVFSNEEFMNIFNKIIQDREAVRYIVRPVMVRKALKQALAEVKVVEQPITAQEFEALLQSPPTTQEEE